LVRGVGGVSPLIGAIRAYASAQHGSSKPMPPNVTPKIVGRLTVWPQEHGVNVSIPGDFVEIKDTDGKVIGKRKRLLHRWDGVVFDSTPQQYLSVPSFKNMFMSFAGPHGNGGWTYCNSDTMTGRIYAVYIMFGMCISTGLLVYFRKKGKKKNKAAGSKKKETPAIQPAAAGHH